MWPSVASCFSTGARSFILATGSGYITARTWDVADGRSRQPWNQETLRPTERQSKASKSYLQARTARLSKNSESVTLLRLRRIATQYSSQNHTARGAIWPMPGDVCAESVRPVAATPGGALGQLQGSMESPHRLLLCPRGPVERTRGGANCQVLRPCPVYLSRVGHRPGSQPGRDRILQCFLHGGEGQEAAGQGWARPARTHPPMARTAPTAARRRFFRGSRQSGGPGPRPGGTGEGTGVDRGHLPQVGNSTFHGCHGGIRVFLDCVLRMGSGEVEIQRELWE